MAVHLHLAQRFLEASHILAAGAHERHALDFVVANEVYIRAHAAGQARELFGVLDLIVHSAEQNVLKRDLASGLDEPLLASIEQLGNRRVFGPRDDLSAQFVEGRVQRKRERHGDFEVAQLANCRGHAHRRHRDLARADTQAPRCVDGADGLSHAVEIRQRLAHAHEDDIGNAANAGQSAEAPDLFDDAARAEISVKSADA